MANSITLAEKYVPLLDEKFKMESKTDMLAQNEQLLREGATADTILIPKRDLQGLGDYSRASGFVDGDVTLSWETHQFTQDRGRSFQVDAMDDAETAGAAFLNLASDFIRLHVAPEIDAYRFAEMASAADTVVNADLSNTDTVEAIDTAVAAMDDAEVPSEGRILYVTPTVYKNIKQSDQFDRDYSGTVEDRNFPTFDGMEVVKVPQSRFYTGITLQDGTTGGEEDGGYTPTLDDGEYEINFMIVHPIAVLPLVKHRTPRIFSPAVNQSADAYKYDYRVYHDMFVPDNKVEGIYCHTKGTAMTS